jgi:hypothetical protein
MKILTRDEVKNMAKVHGISKFEAAYALYKLNKQILINLKVSEEYEHINGDIPGEKNEAAAA